MTPLTERAVTRLQDVLDWPDLSATRYEVLDRIGRGGMGSVFRARDVILRREVAIKVCGWTASPSPAILLQEARVLATLEHPGIVAVHDAGTLADGRTFYVMALVTGERLDSCIGRVRSLADRLRLFDRLCGAVAAAHAANVAHRDLKPANIVVSSFGDVRILDWGLAAAHGESRLAGGTPGYMAPEQRVGADTGAAADIYALGTILRELASDADVQPGHRPRALQAIVSRATAADPEARYPSVVALASDVRHLTDGAVVSAHPELPIERVRRVLRTYRTPISLVAAYLLMRILLWTFLAPRG